MMHRNRSHPLLAQVPLTVSPFVNLPAATTLPYTYKTMPSTLPPSVTGIGSTPAPAELASGSSAAGSSDKPRYVVSASGHRAHPDEIVASCRALEAYVAKLQSDADAELRALEQRIRARDLAEKRRVAPGWLDSEARLLEPDRPAAGSPGAGGGADAPARTGPAMDGAPSQLLAKSAPGGPGLESASTAPDEGEQLDRVFGSLVLGKP